MAIRGLLVWVLMIISGVAVLGYVWNRSVPGDENRATVSVKYMTFSVDVADTIQSRAAGLSGREFLADDEGMLFIFPSSKIRRFWMKDMLIPIDIIWVNGNEIVGYFENVEPEPGVPLTGLEVYYSPQPVDKVLEFPAGTVHKLRLETGNIVTIQF